MCVSVCVCVCVCVRCQSPLEPLCMCFVCVCVCVERRRGGDEKGVGVFVLGSVCCSARSGSAALRCSPGLTLLPHHQHIMLVLGSRCGPPPVGRGGHHGPQGSVSPPYTVVARLLALVQRCPARWDRGKAVLCDRRKGGGRWERGCLPDTLWQVGQVTNPARAYPRRVP